MKIVEICTADSLGGLELYFVSCCKKLQERGNEVFAIVSPNTKLHRTIKDESIICYPLKGNILVNFRSLRKLIKKEKPHVIHIHHKRDLLLGALTKWLSKENFKYVHTRQMDLPRSKKNLYHNFIYSKVDLLIAITNRLKDQIIERIKIDPKKVVTLYYGVPKPSKSSCEQLDLEDENFNIGVIARIDRKKEQHILIESVEKLKKEGFDDVKVYLIGGSTDEEYHNLIIDRISDLKLEDDIILCGFKPNPQSLMPCFDVVVLTTGNETFGLVLPEAMRMGVAVIGANGGGVPEIITHGSTGLIFEAGNPTSLAEQILKMKNSKTRENLAQNGMKSADKRFEINHHFEELEKLFSKKLF